MSFVTAARTVITTSCTIRVIVWLFAMDRNYTKTADGRAYRTRIECRPASLTLDPMKLHVARLCLDCDEIHDEQRCPLCGSASFGYISRWIPVGERRTRPRPVINSPTVDTYREMLTADQSQSDKSRWLRRGAIGVTAVSLAGWIWRRKLAGNRRETNSEGQAKEPK